MREYVPCSGTPPNALISLLLQPCIGVFPDSNVKEYHVSKSGVEQESF